MVMTPPVGGELFTDYSDHPRQTCHAKPKTQLRSWRYQLFPVCLPQAVGLKDFLSQSQDAVALQQIKERGALPMTIVVISVRQSTVAAISGLHCRALVMVSSSIRLTAWLQNSRSGRNGQRDWMYEQSHRDYLRSGYLHHRLPVMGC